ncbi:hypothetical protein COU60_00005 [Candidatus Pacearchaeota archaeon CG10_big_fil_rev_8_21_14_0_10_34_76]|nr:MAG: hypothetical protein COU60_00005 [Candidatus Pacearchaeota archaeon CG10_big_fil_rev_8_21_14_0_10_34_76]
MMIKTEHLFVALLILVSLASTISANGNENIILEEGKNFITIDTEILASELLLLNPSIEAISYFDEDLQTTLGYVNIFGGIGKNFYLRPGVEYEIFAGESIILNVTDLQNGS